jgi:lysophospholipase L1-like esterase
MTLRLPYPVKLLAALALAALGALLTLVRARLALGGGFALVAAGLVWLVRTLLYEAPPDSRRYRHRRTAALTLASTAISLALGAAALILLRVPPRGTHNQFDAELGWAPALVDAEDSDGIDLSQSVGQRLHAIDPGREQILVLGDSVIFGWGVRDEETAVARLGAKLPRYQVLNGAVSGYSIDQYYLYARRLLPKLRARYLVVGIYSGNDYPMTVHGDAYGHSKPFFVVEGGKLVHTNPSLSPYNCVDWLARSLLFRHLWRWREAAQSLTRYLCSAPQLTPTEEEQVVAALLRAIAELCREHGVQLVYLLLPDRNDFTSDEWIAKESRLPTFRRLLADGGYDVLDFYRDVVASKIDPPSLYLDPAHLTAQGHQLLADALLRHLRERYPGSW